MIAEMSFIQAVCLGVVIGCLITLFFVSRMIAEILMETDNPEYARFFRLARWGVLCFVVVNILLTTHEELDVWRLIKYVAMIIWIGHMRPVRPLLIWWRLDTTVGSISTWANRLNEMASSWWVWCCFDLVFADTAARILGGCPQDYIGSARELIPHLRTLSKEERGEAILNWLTQFRVKSAIPDFEISLPQAANDIECEIFLSSTSHENITLSEGGVCLPPPSAVFSPKTVSATV